MNVKDKSKQYQETGKSYTFLRVFLKLMFNKMFLQKTLFIVKEVQSSTS